MRHDPYLILVVRHDDDCHFQPGPIHIDHERRRVVVDLSHPTAVLALGVDAYDRHRASPKAYGRRSLPDLPLSCLGT